MVDNVHESVHSISEFAIPHEEEEVEKPRKWRRVKKKKPQEQQHLPTELQNVPGVKVLTISPSVQKTLDCAVGENITAENPWTYIAKELLQDNLELHEESSEFLPIKKEILKYPREKLLLVYIPSETRECDDFYVCCTEFAEKAFTEIIKTIVNEREERLKNTVLKKVGVWKTKGSAIEIDQMRTNKKNRSLLEVEVEGSYPIMPFKKHFRLKLAHNIPDGYAELLSTRQSFSNVCRKLVDVAVQVAPSVAANAAQTTYPFPKNVYTQYQYGYDPNIKVGKNFHKNMKKFIQNTIGYLTESASINSSINFYENDYTALITDERYTTVPLVWLLKPFTSLAHPLLCKRKEVAYMAWHPMWSGIIALGYADEKACDYVTRTLGDEVLNAMYDVAPVLLWSFKDTLNPKLLLETTREIAVLSFCPYDENLLVGGCVNGQIVLWDITNRLQGVEEEEFMTDARRRYRTLMQSMVGWMKNTKDPKMVRITAISDVEYSHREAVTTISWISPYREITKCGTIQDIPEEDKRMSLQFMTSSRDGTVLSWDLHPKSVSYGGSNKPGRKLRRLQKRPSNLTMDISPFRCLHRLLKPIFKVDILEPNGTRNIPISNMHIQLTAPKYTEANPDPKLKYHITNRILYKPILIKPTNPLLNQFVAGTTEGDFFFASWEGFAFNAGEVVNKETCKFTNFGKYHDGPLVSVSRSEIYSDLVLTVGGSIFALWMKDFIGRPALWRRSKVKYTNGVWQTLRPSIFRLSRVDGGLEMWHLRTRSDSCFELVDLSGQSLGPSRTHSLPLKQNVIGFIHVKGYFQLYYIAQNLTLATEEDRSSTYRMCAREVERKTQISEWQKRWMIKNAKEILLKKEREKELLLQKEEELKLQKEREMLLAEMNKNKLANIDTGVSRPLPGRFTEWAQEQRLIKEKERLRRIVLSKKALDFDVLEKQQLPILKRMREHEQKEIKKNLRMNMASQIFDDTVAMYFPDTIRKASFPDQDPHADPEVPLDVKQAHFNKFNDEVVLWEEHIAQRPHVYRYDWKRTMVAGRERRKALDGYYTRYNHKYRILRENLIKEQEYLATLALKAQQKVRPIDSSHSINQGMDLLESENDAEDTISE